LNEPSEPIDDVDTLLRQADARAVRAGSRIIKPAAFNLRLARQERTLSMYLASRVNAESLLLLPRVRAGDCSLSESETFVPSASRSP
jgi:hypothetical protein